MIRTLLSFSPPFPAFRLIPACFLALTLCACSSQPRPGEIPDVPPLAHAPAAEVPARTFTTIPTDPTAVIPETPPPASAPLSDQDQRIAALELSLLNMSHELAWLKSQPASSTTPWGTPSPKVMPAGSRETKGAPPATAPVAAPATAQAAPPAAGAPAATPAGKDQVERIAALERTMQGIREELVQLRASPAPPSPWGKTAPVLTVPQTSAAAAPPTVPAPAPAQVQPQPQAPPPNCASHPQRAPATPPSKNGKCSNPSPCIASKHCSIGSIGPI